MEPAQDKLRQNIAKFTKEIEKLKYLDFHIGVLTTDNEGYSNPCCGKLWGTPTFVDKNTPNLADTLRYNMMVGISGSGREAMFAPVQQALTTHLTGWNDGFYRTNAFLSIVMITDTREQSFTINANQFYDFLLKLKGGNAGKITAYGVIKKYKELSVCPPESGEDAPDQILESFFKMVVNANNKGGNTLSLCATDFSDGLIAFARDIAERAGGIIYLNRLPVLASIKVTYGTQVIPNDSAKGWSYDPKLNAIRISPNVELQDQPNAKIKVDFETVTNL
jgi:hypothetical protein